MRNFILAVFCLLAAACGKSGRAPTSRPGPLAPPSYWVWHRSSALKPAEIENLRQAGTKTLYWQAVECGWKDGKWDAVRITAAADGIEGITVIPVFRIKPEPGFLGSPDTAASLARLFTAWTEGKSFSSLQLDFDCPDRLLDVYGKFLRDLGRRLAPVKLSITALASWPRRPGFQQLAASVSSMAPMFYDLQADAPEDVLSGRFQPMADPKSAELIEAWSACPVPWLAGLPNFERISVFNHDGSLSGHLRGWTHDDLFFRDGLKPTALGQGITLYDNKTSFSLSGTPVAAGSKIVYRAPDAATLEKLSKAADQAGAAGVIYFALPGPGIQAAYSASHLAGKLSPRLALTVRENGSVVLTNQGPADLAANPAEGAWTLVLQSETAGTFRSGMPGYFPRVEVPGGLPAELATRVILHFSKLSAGGSIESGPVIADGKKLRWSVPGAAAEPIVLEAK